MNLVAMVMCEQDKSFRKTKNSRNCLKVQVEVRVEEEDKPEPKWQLGLKEAEGRKHRIIRVVEGKIGSTA